MRATDRLVGIALGILLGLVIVIAFLFLGSRDAIDDPSISGDTPSQTQTAPQDGAPQPPLTGTEPGP